MQQHATAAAAVAARNTATPRHELLDEITFSVLSAEQFLLFCLRFLKPEENHLGMRFFDLFCLGLIDRNGLVWEIKAFSNWKYATLLLDIRHNSCSF